MEFLSWKCGYCCVSSHIASCVEAGFQACCAEHSDECLLTAGGGECYCDQECYRLDDCCTDIGDICPPPGNGSVCGSGAVGVSE